MLLVQEVGPWVLGPESAALQGGYGLLASAAERHPLNTVQHLNMSAGILTVMPRAREH